MIKEIMLFVEIIISIPKTLYVNFRLFNFSTAIKLPIYIHYNVEIIQLYKNSIKLNTKKISIFMIKLGIGGSNAIKNSKGKIFLSKKNKGTMTFEGKAKFSNGIVLYVNGGSIKFGDNFSCNKCCFISSDNEIIFGNDVLLGWNVSIRDSDGHKIIYLDEKKRYNNVFIGNHVWICSYVDILKNSKIGNDCIVGYKSLVTNLTTDNNKLIVGAPAKVVKDNINWEK